MKTITDIYNETLNREALVLKSLYAEFDNKVVRYSDHACKPCNFDVNNEGAEEILLVFVNSEMTEQEMQDNAEEVSDYYNGEVYVDFLYFNEDDDYLNDVKLLKMQIERFIK